MFNVLARDDMVAFANLTENRDKICFVCPYVGLTNVK